MVTGKHSAPVCKELGKTSPTRGSLPPSGEAGKLVSSCKRLIYFVPSCNIHHVNEGWGDILQTVGCLGNFSSDCILPRGWVLLFCRILKIKMKVRHLKFSVIWEVEVGGSLGLRCQRPLWTTLREAHLFSPTPQQLF